jgi:hypothetical protein
MPKRREPNGTESSAAISVPAAPAPPVEIPARAKRFQTWIAALVFAGLVGIMWGAFNPRCGMPQETGFPYFSETSSAIRGFLYSDDPMRIHTNTFYQLSYLLGEAFGIRGSYFPYQVVYALLWWARGMLVFAILRRFLPDCPSLCYSAGALVLVHSCDGATILVEQMNQIGFMFWMLLAMYCFQRAWGATRRWVTAALAATAAALEYMSLWSYESQILLILMFPIAVMLARREWKKPVLLIAWFSVPLVYLVLTYLRYTHSGGGSYQESVMRKSWSVAGIAGDWAFNIANSLAFWSWARDDWQSPPIAGYLLGALTALVFAAGWVAVIQIGSDRGRPNPFAVDIRSCWILLAGGFAALALSFPVYLVLSSARGLWRTQLLSGIGTGIVVAAILGLISWLPGRRLGKMAVVLTAGAVFVYAGSVSAIQKGSRNRTAWEWHRKAVREILRIAPSVEPGTVIVFTNLSRDHDMFLHNMWFDLALRLMYPGVPVTGAYYFADGSPGPGINLVLEGKSWRWEGKGFGGIVTTTGIAKTIVIAWGPSGTGKLIETLPSFLCKAGCAPELYQPSAAIVLDPVSPIAARRFNLPRQEAGSLF